MDIKLPAQFNKYTLLEYLGGGMSYVYRARDNENSSTVVVKILAEANPKDTGAKARFLLEAQIGSTLSHPNIIRILQFGEEGSLPFMVMNYLEGEDLSQVINNGHTGDLRNNLRIALQIARALEYVHSQKVIHRDIKPENVHIGPSSHVTLMDFGIAKAENLRLTRTGTALGTPFYMSPEQVRGDPVTELSDVYAFGIMIYELMCGLKGNDGNTVDRVFYQILNRPLNFEPLKQLGIPQGVCALIARCTVKKPLDRIQNFTSICDELERLIKNPNAMPTVELSYVQKLDTIKGPWPPLYYKPRRRVPVFRILFLILFVVFPLGYFFGPAQVRTTADDFLNGPSDTAKALRAARKKITAIVNSVSDDKTPLSRKKSEVRSQKPE